MNPFVSLRSPVSKAEQMDAVELPAAAYAQVLADLGRVNRATLAMRPTLAFLKSILRLHASSQPWRILDVGYGDGGMLRAIRHWAEQRSQPVALTGVDLNPNSEATARQTTPAAMNIEWLAGDYRELGNRPWDIVISSLVTHHMSTAERLEFLTFMEQHARLGWFVNDLHRHRLAFMSYPILATCMRVHPIVRADGQLSVARSFRTEEWQTTLLNAGLYGEARVRRFFPFRLCIERMKHAAAAHKR